MSRADSFLEQCAAGVERVVEHYRERGVMITAIESPSEGGLGTIARPHRLLGERGRELARWYVVDDSGVLRFALVLPEAPVQVLQ